MNARTITPAEQLLTERLAVSIEELSTLSGLSRATISRRIASGQIHAARESRRVLIPVREAMRVCGIDQPGAA